MKKYVMMLLIVFVLPTIGYCKGFEHHKFFDNLGFDYQYGNDSMYPESLQGKHSRNKVTRFSVRAENKTILPEKWTVQGEIHYSKTKADEYPDNGQDTWFEEIGFNLVVKRTMFDLFYIGGFAGVSKALSFPEFENRDWADRDIESNIGRSGVLGSWGGLVGKDWFLNTNWGIRTEVRLTHTSDPFRTDRGKNYGAGIIGLTYRFGKNNVSN